MRTDLFMVAHHDENRSQVQAATAATAALLLALSSCSDDSGGRRAARRGHPQHPRRRGRERRSATRPRSRWSCPPAPTPTTSSRRPTRWRCSARPTSWSPTASVSRPACSTPSTRPPPTGCRWWSWAERSTRCRSRTATARTRTGSPTRCGWPRPPAWWPRPPTRGRGRRPDGGRRAGRRAYAASARAADDEIAAELARHPRGPAAARHQPRGLRVLRRPLRLRDRRHGDPQRHPRSPSRVPPSWPTWWHVIEETGVPAIFADTSDSAALLDALADEIGEDDRGRRALLRVAGRAGLGRRHLRGARPHQRRPHHRRPRAEPAERPMTARWTG